MANIIKKSIKSIKVKKRLCSYKLIRKFPKEILRFLMKQQVF